MEFDNSDSPIEEGQGETVAKEAEFGKDFEDIAEESPALDELAAENQTDASDMENEVAEILPEAVEEEPPAKKLNVRVIAFAVIILLALGIFGVKYLSANKKSPSTPLMYFSIDPATEAGAIHLNGAGMQQESLLGEALFSHTSQYMPLAVSPDAKTLAYVGDGGELYHMPLKVAEGTMEAKPEYLVYPTASEVLEFSPESNLLYFLDENRGLCVYNSVEATLVDENALIVTMQDGRLTLFVLDNNRIVYTRQRDEKIYLVTTVIGESDSTVEIAQTTALSDVNPSAQGLTYYLLPEGVNLEDGTIPEISGHYYSFSTRTSQLLSGNIAEVFWEGSGERFLFLEMMKDEAAEMGFKLNLFYREKGENQLIAENISPQPYFSEELEAVVYGEKEMYYIQSLQGGVGDKHALFPITPDENVSFEASKTERLLYTWQFKQEEEFPRVNVYPIAASGKPDAPAIVDEGIEYLLPEQMNGNLLYIKNVQNDMMGDLYAYVKGRRELLIEKVWLPSLDAVRGEEYQSGDLLVLTVENYNPAEITLANLVLFHDGKTQVIAADVPANMPGEELQVLYKDGSQIYYIKDWNSTSGGTLYRYTGGAEMEPIAENVFSMM